MITIFSAPADEGGPLAYGKSFLLPRNVCLESLTWVNKGATGAYIQLFNTPRPVAWAITNSSIGLTEFTVTTGSGFVNGDAVTLTGVTGGPLTGYYRKGEDDTTFSLHATRADALSGTDPIAPGANGDTGTLDLTSNITSAPVAEEYPVLAEPSAPANVGSLTNARFGRGLYVRAVTAASGSTLISADDVKFTPRYRTHPINNPLTYED